VLISELITHLEEAQQQNGDVEIYLLTEGNADGVAVGGLLVNDEKEKSDEPIFICDEVTFEAFSVGEED
jgi:hypothetical protein